MHGRHVDGMEDYQSSERWRATREAIRLLQDEFPQEQELGF